MDLPIGFELSGVRSGVKYSGLSDLALVVCEKPATAAGVYTQNVVRAASIDWNRHITPTDKFRGLVVNSGNANACTGEQGVQDNKAMAETLSKLIGASSDQICVLSTGIIGHHLPMAKIESGIAQAYDSRMATDEGFQKAAKAILTTDKSPKTAFRATENFCIASMAKGAGMIGPNMATMLGIALSDVQLTPELAQRVLTRVANRSFNRISVEGHTSTNDALLLICSGEGKRITENDGLVAFEEALTSTCIELAKMIPADGEGASHLISIQVNGAANDADADRVARTIAASALVKTAVSGSDPNWGRIVSAAGYSGAEISGDRISLKINDYLVFEKGKPVPFDEPRVSQDMRENFENRIDLEMGTGPGKGCHWTSDLTLDYVRFNSEYST